uniref:Uncharacterized protein n=1 Tax=Tanacetum cinerariifolium TaxID=118510 RepID=A0A699HE73_TANCI|nr:hypothetical protein [Tanacetum cinerariifolium]
MALLQSSWPSHSHFYSNVDRYDTKTELCTSDYHHEYSSSSVSSVDLPMLSNDYDHGHYGLDHGVHDDHAMEIDTQTRIENLLMAYADAMGMEHEELAKVIAKCISEKANPNGSPLERIVFNLLQRQEHQEEAYLKHESLRNFVPAFRAFYSIFPYGRFAHFTACSAIIEAVPCHVDVVHIVDFDICEGAQWPLVIEAVARIKKSLIITSIKLDQDQDSQFQETKRNLSNFARVVGLNLKVQEIGLREMEERASRSEFTAFNCMVGLPHMGRTRNRAQVMDFLKLAKGVLAKTEGIITFGAGERERITNDSDYTPFFNKVLAHYQALYESMEWGFPSYLNEARIAMETLFLAPFVSSSSWFQTWEEQRENMVFDGLKGERMSMESWNEAKELVKEGETPYKIGIEGRNGNEMVLKWKDIPLVRVYAWK